MTATDTVVLVELADGNYLPLPDGIARGTAGVTFLGLDAAGDAVVHVTGLAGPFTGEPGPEVVNARALPAPWLDADDYRASVACAACGAIGDDLTDCDRCGGRTCRCDHEDEGVPPWPSNP